MLIDEERAPTLEDKAIAVQLAYRAKAWADFEEAFAPFGQFLLAVAQAMPSPRETRPVSLFHVTTPKKARRYRQSGAIHAPVRGFTTMEGAMAWGMKTGRTVIYEIRFDDADLHKLPEHHNHLGSAWWVDADVPVEAIQCVFSAEKDA